MEIFIKVVQLLLSLAILVIFHELGHFIAARIFKIRVEKFYLFFDAWFSLFKFKKGETEYGIGWIPLGGYVKIAGMIDESLDTEQMKQPPQPWELRSKPAWQRLIVMLGGVTVNILLAIGIYIVLLAGWGEQYLPTSQVKYGIAVDSLGAEMGLRNGDYILSVENKPIEDFDDIARSIMLEQARTVQVMRNGIRTDVPIPDGFVGKLMKQTAPGFITPRFPFEAGKFAIGSPAEAAGMMLNDRIIGLNDTILPYFDQFRSMVQRYKNKTVQVTVLRGTDTVRLKIDVPAAGLIGVHPKGLSNWFTLKEKHYSIFTAIPAGVSKTFDQAWVYIRSITLLFSQEKGYESLGGFISIGNFFPATWDWFQFWTFTAFLSVMLAILNLLPIPALDGGHVMFLLYEMVFRRKPSDKFMEYAQVAGMVILFGLLIFANGQDIMKLFR